MALLGVLLKIPPIVPSLPEIGALTISGLESLLYIAPPNALLPLVKISPKIELPFRLNSTTKSG